MSYHRLNNLSELVIRDLAAKIGQGIFFKDLMDKKCNCSLPSKGNGNVFHNGKCWSRCIICKVKCSTCHSIYIGNTQQTFKKGMDVHFSDIQRLLKNGQKSEPFYAHYQQHFNTTTSRTDLCKYTEFKVVKQLNPISAMKKTMNPNYNLRMKERLTILKKLHDKCVTVMNKNLEIYWAC